jgi:two-component system alkaline phosphatase synthesis response regulator PhoP
MNVIAQNILNELLRIEKDVFTKDEIVTIINDTNRYTNQPIVESNGIIVNPQTITVTCQGKSHTLPKKLFDLLYYLISNKNTLLKREQIFNEVWGADVYVGMRTIDVHITKLRNFIPKDCIRTTKGVGYQWIEL